MAKGLYANIHAKQEKVKKGLKDPDTGKKIKMRKKGDPGAPTAQDFKDSEKTAKLSKEVILINIKEWRWEKIFYVD